MPPKPKPKPKQPPPIAAALLIGIEYTDYARRRVMERLPGCHYDVSVMRSMLQSGVPGLRVKTLVDRGGNSRPTRKNILKEVNRLIRLARAGTRTIWITYSGHGTRIRDRNGDEADRLDEAIVPSDYISRGCITDDVIRALLAKFPPTCKVCIILDSCYSGTGADLGDVGPIPAAPIWFLSGSAEDETSESVYNSGRWRGALTWAIQSITRTQGFDSLTQPGTVSLITDFLRSHSIPQTPNCIITPR